MAVGNAAVPAPRIPLASFKPRLWSQKDAMDPSEAAQPRALPPPSAGQNAVEENTNSLLNQPHDQPK